MFFRIFLIYFWEFVRTQQNLASLSSLLILLDFVFAVGLICKIFNWGLLWLIVLAVALVFIVHGSKFTWKLWGVPS